MTAAGGWDVGGGLFADRRDAYRGGEGKEGRGGEDG